MSHQQRRLTSDEFLSLIDHGLLPEKIELTDCIVAVAPASGYVFAMKDARAADDLGVRVHSAVDEVLADEEAIQELLRRLSDAQRPADER
jgi:hypothetical protein